jgi:hypothetical protein
LPEYTKIKEIRKENLQKKAFSNEQDNRPEKARKEGKIRRI